MGTEEKEKIKKLIDTQFKIYLVIPKSKLIMNLYLTYMLEGHLQKKRLIIMKD